MVEKNLVIDGLELKYKGLFNLRNLLDKIDELMAEKGYSKSEKRRTESVRPTAKEFSIELRPVKKKEEYFDLMIKTIIKITNLEEVEVIVDEVKKKMHKGEIDITFFAFALTDLKARWEQTPWYYFLRAMFERIFFKVHYDRHIKELMDDTHFIYNNIKAHLNLQRF